MDASSSDFQRGDKVLTPRWGNRMPVGDVVAVFPGAVRVRWHGGQVNDMEPGDLRFVDWDPLTEGWRVVDGPGR
jgi:hypothetical protein